MGAHDLHAVHPDRLEFDGRTVGIGAKGYALLVLVLAQGGAASLIALTPGVYGEQEVSAGRVKQQLHRLNVKIAEVGCALRLSLDGGRVVLV